MVHTVVVSAARVLTKCFFAAIHVMGAIQPRYSLLPCNLMIPQQQTAWKERNVQDMSLVIQSVTVLTVVVSAARALTKCFFAVIHVMGAIQPRYSLLQCNLRISQQQTAWKERNVQDMILVIQSVTVRTVVVSAARAQTKCFFAAIHVVGAIQPRYSLPLQCNLLRPQQQTAQQTNVT